MENKHTITHIEIPALNTRKASEFYSKVFNWTIDDKFGEEYLMFRIGNSGTGGAFVSSLKPADKDQGPHLVINVEDITEKLKEIEEAGGNIILNKTEIPGGFGFYAAFNDLSGNYMQIYSDK